MFLFHRPSAPVIEEFLDASKSLRLSYAPAGIVFRPPARYRFDQIAATIGHGPVDFERARAALIAWKHFDLGWVRLFPQDAAIVPGTTVAVLIRHLRFWSLNAARVVYLASGSDADSRFGFAYGTLTNHAESGEELFEVFIDSATGDVNYRIRAVSRPQAALARVGQPLVRVLQARFRRDSIEAMRKAVQA